MIPTESGPELKHCPFTIGLAETYNELTCSNLGESKFYQNIEHYNKNEY